MLDIPKRFYRCGKNIMDSMILQIIAAISNTVLSDTEVI